MYFILKTPYTKTKAFSSTDSVLLVSSITLIIRDHKDDLYDLKIIYIHTYIHTKLYLNHASLNNRWKAGFHEGREITYLQEINYIQEIQK